MDYKKHYATLCERARNRHLSCYVEKHHVIPRCLGGDDSSENIVELTPEEHYVAHQLLVKIYPAHHGLVWAALRMTAHSSTDKRSNNKLYGWLRKRHQKVAKDSGKQRKGKKNGSYGRQWHYDPVTLDNIKCLPNEVPKGYIKGRKIKPDNNCIVCGKNTGSKLAKYCKIHRGHARHKFGCDEKREKLYERYKNGESLRTLALEINISHVALSRQFKKYCKG